MDIKSGFVFPGLQIISKPLTKFAGFLGLKNSVLYIAEPGWSLRHDAESIRLKFPFEFKNKFKIFRYPLFFKSDIYHFASHFQWVKWYKSIPKNKKYICNYYHGKRTDSEEMSLFVDQFLESSVHLSKILVSNSIVEKRLIEDYKLPKRKICKIPIGVDTKTFKPSAISKTSNLKKKFNIPEGDLVIGSFQKDGEGWKEGNDPKLIKGPDILVNVLNQISKSYPITVVLSAPARGYVIKKLENLGINYIYKCVSHPNELVELYELIDLYLITSREEGGPKGLMEALSMGKKVVTTPVGMSTDLKKCKIKNLLVSETFNYDEIKELCSQHLKNKENPHSLESHKIIKDYCSWERVAHLHMKKLYVSA